MMWFIFLLYFFTHSINFGDGAVEFGGDDESAALQQILDAALQAQTNTQQVGAPAAPAAPAAPQSGSAATNAVLNAGGAQQAPPAAPAGP